MKKVTRDAWPNSKNGARPTMNVKNPLSKRNIVRNT
jgi:hypothetical protein